MEMRGRSARRLARAGLVLAGLSVLAGCTSLPRPVPAGPVANYRLREVRAGIHVALDPFFLGDRTRQTFTGGEDFIDRGLLPVQVILENRSESEVRVEPRDAIVVMPRGDRAASLHPEDAYHLVKLSVGWWALGAGAVGGSPQAYRNEARRKDLQLRALTAQTVPPGGSANGFLYFQINESETNLAGSRVIVPVSPAAGAPLTFEIALEGRRDIAAPSAASAPAGSGLPGIRTDPSAQPGTILGTGGRGIIIRSP